MLLIGEQNEVFRDNDFIRYGDTLDDEIAASICKSVCLLIVYVPNTYQADHPYCAREYAAMCELEQNRLGKLQSVLRPEKGPILTIPYRGKEETLPTELADRGTYEFGAWQDLSNDPDLQELPALIAEDIAQWCNLFANQSTPPIDGGCDGFLLPQQTSVKAQAIVAQQASCGFRFPSRSN